MASASWCALTGFVKEVYFFLSPFVNPLDDLLRHARGNRFATRSARLHAFLYSLLLLLAHRLACPYDLVDEQDLLRDRRSDGDDLLLHRVVVIYAL